MLKAGLIIRESRHNIRYRIQCEHDVKGYWWCYSPSSRHGNPVAIHERDMKIVHSLVSNRRVSI